MERVFTNIMHYDKDIFRIAYSLNQPFTLKEWFAPVHEKLPLWNIKVLAYRCKDLAEQGILEKCGHFYNRKYRCLLTPDELEYSKCIRKYIDLSDCPFVCGL